VSSIWLTSDTHFSHAKILASRPQFRSIEEHDETLIDNWNRVVRRGDRVYHHGDVALGKPEPIAKLIRRLNGQIYLISGNHDGPAQHKACVDRFVWIRSLETLKVGETKLVMCHYAMRTWNCQHHGAIHTFGHSHGTLPDDERLASMDVGVDTNDFRPYAFEEVCRILKRKRERIAGPSSRETKRRHEERNPSLAERLKAAVVRNGQRPAAERWQALIDRGAINEKGEVLIKGPFGEEGE
jgi:calcineurin-like phosphoesterase family protein